MKRHFLAMYCLLLWSAGRYAAGDVVHDNLCITDEGMHRHYPFNICGGAEYFGEAQDWQLADRFVIDNSYWITLTTMDYATIYGSAPDGICAEVYNGGTTEHCGLPDRLPYWTEALHAGSFEWEPIALRELEGRRATVRFTSPCRLPKGKWYLAMQPVTDVDAVATPAADSFDEGACAQAGCMVWRWGDWGSPCCEHASDPIWDATAPEPWILAMRVEGIPAGDCTGGETVRAKCKPGDGERLGKVIVKVTDGEPHGAVTALFDPPDPQHVSLALDAMGRGKGKFKRVSAGDHRIFVCDSILDVSCAE